MLSRVALIVGVLLLLVAIAAAVLMEVTQPIGGPG
jgi:hypothetical protein